MIRARGYRHRGLLLLGLLSSYALMMISAQAEQIWPRHIDDDAEGITLEAPPQRIVSTSVTLTGSLLAIDAPLVGSAATTPNSVIADPQGFFKQWGSIAQQRHLTRLYIGTPDLEAIAVQAPDLIVISANGADSALKMKASLAQIAPTLVINYDHRTWQDITRQLGLATGHEAQAEARIQAFSAALAETRRQLNLPSQPVSAFTWSARQSNSANLWTPTSAQGQLLKALGIRLAAVPSDLADYHQMGQRQDIIPVHGERLAEALTGNSWLVFAAEDDTIEALKQHVFLKSTEAIRHQRVYALGAGTFRLDYYSAMQLLARLHDLFAPSATVP